MHVQAATMRPLVELRGEEACPRTPMLLLTWVSGDLGLREMTCPFFAILTSCPESSSSSFYLAHLFFLHGNGPTHFEYGWEAHERGRAKGHGRKAEQ